MLLALTSASGCWKIRHLHVSFTQNLVKNFVLIRLSQPNRKQQTSLYQCYNLNLFKMIIRFVFRGIRRVYFLRKTRKKSKHTKFLLSHIEPHSPVKTCRLSRWTCQVLKYAGINTKMFKPNSKGKTFGISLGQIQHRKNYIIKRYFQKQPLSNQFWRIEKTTNFGDIHSIRSTEILWNEIENYNKEWSKTVPPSPNHSIVLNFVFSSCLGRGTGY